MILFAWQIILIRAVYLSSLALYLAPIGCIIFIVEWEKLFYEPVVKYFPFLKHHTGRAAFYLL